MFMKNRNRLDEQKNEIWIGKKNRNGEKVQIGHFKRILSISCFLSVFLLIAFTFCWLKIESVKGETKVYKVACIKEPGYFEYDSEESPYGYCVEYLNKISEQTGWKYEYYGVDSWEEAAAMLDNHSVDLILPFKMMGDRSTQYKYIPTSIGTEYGALLTNGDNQSLTYEDFDEFENITVGCVESTIFYQSFCQYAQDNDFQSNVVMYPTMKDLYLALSLHQVDAIAISDTYTNLGLKVLGKYDLKPVYIVTRQDNVQLANEINEQIVSIKTEYPEFEVNLLKKYFPKYNVIPFTKSELEYINEAPVFEVGYIANIAPIAYEDNSGEAVGMSRELLDKIQEISGLKFSYHMMPNDIKEEKYFKDNQIDLFIGMIFKKDTTELAKYKLSNSFMESNMVLIGKKEIHLSADAPYRVAIVSNALTLQQKIRSIYPNCTFQVYDDLESAMNAIVDGKEDLLLTNEYFSQKFLPKQRYADLTVVSQPGISESMCIGTVSNKESEKYSYVKDERLLSIINKSIVTITDQEKTEIILNEVAKNQYDFAVKDFFHSHMEVIIFLIAVIVIIQLFLLYIYLLKQKNYNAIVSKEKRIQLQNEHFSLLLRKSQELLFDYNIVTHECTFSDQFETKFDWTLPQFCDVHEIWEYWMTFDENEKLRLKYAFEKVISGSGQTEEKIRLRKRDGSFGWYKMILNGTGSENNICFVGTLIDINAEMQEREVLIQMAQTDKLTGLLNKQAFYLKGEEFLKDPETKSVAVLFIDLDNFKNINDLLGHMTGDLAISQTAEKLKEIMPKSSVLSRFGGDEFVILVRNLPEKELKVLLNKIHHELNTVYSNDSKNVSVSSSVGYFYANGAGGKIRNLVEYADMAAYYSKESGKNQYTKYYNGIQLNGYHGNR